jgi:hypothetical protein
MTKKPPSSKNKNSLTKNWQIIGWQELVMLPELSMYNSDLGNLYNIKIIAKIDSGAKTSTINAINLKITKNDDQLWAEFYVKSNIEEDNLWVNMPEFQVNENIYDCVSVQLEIETIDNPLYILLINKSYTYNPLVTSWLRDFF